MNTTAEWRTNLGQISSALARIHKTLLENELEERENKLQIKMGPADRLHALLHDPELDWLRALSQLMAAVDEIYFQKEPIEKEQWEKALKNVQDLMDHSNQSTFSIKYRQLLPLVPDLMPHHGLLRLALK